MGDPFDLPSTALLCDLYGKGTYDSVRFVQFDSPSNDDENDQRSHAAVIVAVPSSNGEEMHKIERNDDDDDDEDLLPRLVVDSVPKAKHLNISSRILYPVRRLDEGGSQGASTACTYAVGRITHKDYKPVRVEVTFAAEGRGVERFDQAEVRPFITPWSWIETRRRHRRLVPRDSVEASSLSSSSSSSRPGVDVVARGRVGKSVRYRKGELRSTATGEVQKYNGKQWRRICAEPKCWKEVQKFGFCSCHMEKNLNVTKSGKKKKQNSDATTTETPKESASAAAPPRSEVELEVAMAMSMLERPVVLHGPSSVGSLIPTAPPSAADASDRESVGVSECGGGLRVPSPVARNVDSFGVGTPPCTPLQPMPPYYLFSPHSFVWCCPYNY